MEPLIISRIFLGTLIVKTIVQAYLEMRQIKVLEEGYNKVPVEFKDTLSLEDHNKAMSYSLEKLRVGRFIRFFHILLLLFWTVGGGLEILHRVALYLAPAGDVWLGLTFFGLLGFITSILSLPESYYLTFVLEEKYDFNKATKKIFVQDLFKGLILSVIIGGPVLAVILWLMTHLNNQWWLYAFFFIVAFQMLMIFIYPTFIAPLFNKFSPLQDAELVQKIQALLARCEFQAKGLFVMDASKRTGHGNAYFTGFGKNKRIVFFDTLLKNLDTEEVEAILAHELGHYKRHHIYKMIFVSWLSLFVGLFLLNYFMQMPHFFMGHGVLSQNHHLTLAVFSMVSGVYTYFTTPISTYFSRKHEYEADEFAAKFSNKLKLISSLVKLYKENASSTIQDSLYSNFYHSHPNAKDRITALKKL